MPTGRHGQPDHSSLGGEAAFGGVVVGIRQRLRGETAHAAELPSPKDGARCLGGYASKAGFIRFPGPGRDRKDRSCTVKFDPNAPDGFVVADARKEINGLDLKDYVKERWGLPPFSRARRGRSNGPANGHRPAGGSNAHDHAHAETPPPSRVYLIPFGSIRLNTRRRDIVQGLFPRDGLTVLWGAPKCGKSFLALDIGLHVANGWEYRGRKVQQGPVVLCAYEGGAGTQTRIEAWRQKFLAENCAAAEVEFYLMPVTLNLVKEAPDLIAATKQICPKPPALIILDTLNRSLAGSESNDADMAAYVRAADALREAFGCAVVIVHHCGHNDSRPRGHTSLIGAADAVIAVKKEVGTSIFFTTVEMMKDGEAGAVFASQLESVEVGHDEDEVAITSCIVRPIERTTPKKSEKTPKLATVAKIALDALTGALAASGSIPPNSNHIPANTQTVSLSLWRRYVYQRNPESNAEARKKSFQNSRKSLQARGIIGIWGTENCSEEQVQCWLVT